MKFNKDSFSSDIIAHVQSAINKGLITKEDAHNNDIDRLHGFIQYELLEYIKDRSYSIDVLKNFSYDQDISWESLQNEYGEFKSLLDVALVNLWLYLKSMGATSYDYYEFPNEIEDNLLDIVHSKEENEKRNIEQNPTETPHRHMKNIDQDNFNEIDRPSKLDYDDDNFDNEEDYFNGNVKDDRESIFNKTKPRRKIRLAKN